MIWGEEGPDFASGYGNTNAAQAILTMLNKRFLHGLLAARRNK